jgi:hypothetical protein
VTVGRVVGSSADGEPLVDFAGTRTGPLAARVLATTGLDLPRDHGVDVLLLFEQGDMDRPIIVGVLAERNAAGRTVATGRLPRDANGEVVVDGTSVTVTAAERLVFSCGRSSITLHADGRVIVKGTRLVSRASESNKIKGATIALN